jgi:hypothetical protein
MATSRSVGAPESSNQTWCRYDTGEKPAGTEQLSARHRRYAANIRESGTVLLRRLNDLLEQARGESFTGVCDAAPACARRFESAA